MGAMDTEMHQELVGPFAPKQERIAMNFGVPKEIREQEKRVGMTPAGAHVLVHEGHKVFIETNAGGAAGFTDADYLKEGAQIVYTECRAASRWRY